MAAPAVLDPPAPTPTALHPDASDVLEVLAAHRLATADQVHAIVLPHKSLRWVQAILRDHLAARGLAACVKAQGRDRTLLWYATGQGVVAVHGSAVGRYVMDEAKAIGPAAEHTLAVNDVGLALLHVARTRGDDFGPLSWQHEVAIETGRRGRGARLVADAAVSYIATDPAGPVHAHRLVEVERCNQQPDVIAAKVRAYADALCHGAWRERWPGFPPVLFVFCPGGQVRPDTRMASVFELLDADDDLAAMRPRGLRVQLTTLDLLARLGPFAGSCWEPWSDAATAVPVVAL